MNTKEYDDIWRLYRREWVIVHTLDTVHINGDLAATGLIQAAHRWAEDHLTHVRRQDWRVTAHTDNNGTYWGYVEVFRDNLKGEFKHVENAQAWAHIKGYDEYTIVPRNSKSDHDIRNYGLVLT